MKDEIFSRPLAEITGFSFNENVSRVFDDMIERSVPFYRQGLWLIAEMVHRLYQPASIIYDLGCSTGALPLLLREVFGNTAFRYQGIDNSAHMLQRAKEKLAKIEYTGQASVDLVEADIEDCTFDQAGIVVANYTMQFTRPAARQKLLARIHDQLQPGGSFIMAEKILEDDADSSQLFSELYYDFKRTNEYSELEISQKRESLENVLVPIKINDYLALLQGAGFSKVSIAMKWCNFATILAIK